jgi:hypothetical protein
MKLNYQVHSVNREDVPMRVTVGGREIDAKVPGLVVELVHEGNGHTFRFTPDTDEEFAAAEALFTPGAVISATFAAG